MTGSGESSAERLLAQDGMQRVPSPKVELFQLRDFVPPELCAELIALIETDRRPSTLADAGDDHYFRTSETCDLSADESAVQALENKLTKLTGNSPKIGRGRPGPMLKHDAERHHMRRACLDKCRRRLRCPFNRFFHQNRLA